MSWLRFIVYFAVIIVGVGGLGVWITFGQYWLQVRGISLPDVLSNLATFIVAIAVTSFADYLIIKRQGQEDDRTKSLVLFSFTLLATAAGVCILVISAQHVQIACAWAGGVLAAIIWLCVKSQSAELGGQKFDTILGGSVK